MSASRRIGILGGTFDPIHAGHVDVAHAAESALNLTRVMVIPSEAPPHRTSPAASSFHRFAMVALTVAGRPGWRASDLELRARGTPSYTTTTLGRFHERGYSPSELFFLIGTDAFDDIVTWKDYPRILDLAHFAVVSRPRQPVDDLPARLPSLAGRMVRASNGIDLSSPKLILIDAKTADVSSTAIRKRRADGQSITGLVDLGVEQHIEQHGLYTSPMPGRRANDSDRN
jgi:nicotinate-nucleotide adenylyltransferase